MIGRPRWTFFALLILLAFLSLGPRAEAQGRTELLRVTLADLGYPGDDTVQGVLVSRDYSLRWPDAWTPAPGIRFRLNFRHSPTLDPRSTLTLSFNDQVLTSTTLTPQNAEGGSLEVEIPPEIVQPGYNRLRVDFYMGLEDFNCVDLDDPSIWAVIEDSSGFTLAYVPRVPALDLTLFPLPFVDNSPLIQNRVSILLPEDPTSQEWTAAVTLGARLGQLADWRPLEVSGGLATPEGLNRGVGDQIVLGRLDRLPLTEEMDVPYLKWENGAPVLVDKEGNPLPPKAGVLWLEPRPNDPTSVRLWVTGSTGAGVVTAARALADGRVVPQLVGASAVVLDLPEPPPPEGALGTTLTFQQMGYEDRTAYGSREQTLKYTLLLPDAIFLEDPVRLDLHFAHSRVIDPQRSTLTVVLNGTPMGSVRLSEENADDAWMKLELPARFFKPGNNSLVLRTNMVLPRPAGAVEDPAYLRACVKPPPDRDAWLVAYSDSRITLPAGVRARNLDLGHFPAGFVGPADLRDTGWIVPETAKADTIDAVLKVTARIGRLARGETLRPGAWTPQDWLVVREHPTYQIYFGRPSQNPALAALNELLPQPFREGTDELAPSDVVADVLPPHGQVGLLEAFLEAGKPRLAVTGTGDEGVIWAAGALSDADLQRLLRGDLAILEDAGSIASVRVRLPETLTPKALPPGSEPAPSKSRYTSWILAVAAILFAMALLVLIWVFRERPREEPEGSPTR